MRRILLYRSFTGLALSAALVCGAAAQTPSTVNVRLIGALSSESSRAGDSFTATLAEPLIVGDRIVAQKDARIRGSVREAVSSGRLSRPALITLRLESVQPRSGRYPIQTGDLTVKADSHASRNVLIVGGAAGAGALIGGMTGGGKGASIGAAAGAGAGTLGAYLSGKHEIVLPAETLLTFHVTTVTISPQELSRLQRVSEGMTGATYPGDMYEARDSQPAVILRRRHHDDDDEDDQGEYEGEGREHIRDIGFAERERVIIIDWFRSTGSDLPPGLAKRDRLPPGLEKQLRERGTLPPGLQKRVQPLPYELESRLHRLPAGYSRVVVSGNVVVMDDRTSVICDIIRNVVR
ncbi:MAG: hypothetical protein NVS9B4_03920 [Candidatus Acidiferrum sp.]